MFNISGHPNCLELTNEMVAVILTYPWQCMECKSCVLCSDPQQEVIIPFIDFQTLNNLVHCIVLFQDKMLFCDHCDRGYHTFCVGLAAIPTGRWECPTCRPTLAASQSLPNLPNIANTVTPVMTETPQLPMLPQFKSPV